MSFTLMRYKDGVPAPIKMSIWDAFKGTPYPKTAKPRPVSVVTVIADQVCVPVGSEESEEQAPDVPVECSCCHKVHNQDEDSERAKKKNEAETKEKSKDDKNSSNGDIKDDKRGNTFSTREQETYSEEDNKKIIEMKTNKSNWKPILEAIGKKSESQLKAHWKQIDPSKQANKEGEGDKKVDTDLKKSTAKDDTDANKKEESEKKKGEGQSKKKQKQEANSKSNSEKGKSKKKTSDGKTGGGELKNWSDRYDRQKWIAAASRHFDLTGQRITPDTAKKLADEN